MVISENMEWLRWQLISFYGMLENERTNNPDLTVHQVADMYIQNELSMEEGMRQYHESLTKTWEYNQRILRAVKSVKGKTFHKHLTEFIKNAEATDYHEWEIVSQPVGNQQEVTEYGRAIKKEWVVQYSEGDSGDSWNGTICVQLRENKYLKFHFSM